MPTPDGELIQSCLKGDQSAWQELIGRYQRLIYSVARRLCSSPEDCADVFQAVCLELSRNLNTVRNHQALPAWLITVTRRRAYALVHATPQSVPIGEFEGEGVLDPQLDVIEREFMLERAVDGLPDRCRNLIRLLYLDTDEPSYSEISGYLGIPVASIGPTRARCLEKLRKVLDG